MKMTLSQKPNFSMRFPAANTLPLLNPPGDVMDLWSQILDEGYDELVYIPMSSGLSILVLLLQDIHWIMRKN